MEPSSGTSTEKRSIISSIESPGIKRIIKPTMQHTSPRKGQNKSVTPPVEEDQQSSERDYSAMILSKNSFHKRNKSSNQGKIFQKGAQIVITAHPD